MKGQIIFQLLHLLQEETDEMHRMTQQAISERMFDRYGVRLNRRTLKTYLDELSEAGFPLISSKKPRIQPDGTVEIMQTDWYMEPRFEASELRLLTDLLAAMPAVPSAQREALLKKLMNHASPTCREAQSGRHVVYLHTPPAQQLLFSVDVLCEAIKRDKMVCFQYSGCHLKDDGTVSLEPRRRSSGAVREYLVSPYEIAVSQGRYYLICCKEPYRTVSHYRIDRISEISIMERFDRLPVTELTGRKKLPENLAEQLYMYSGETVACKFLADERILSDVIDWFGEDVNLERSGDHAIAVTVQVHPKAMEHWALQYGEWVEVLEPASLRGELAAAVQKLAMSYHVMPVAAAQSCQ